jgi:hypothetical protein
MGKYLMLAVSLLCVAASYAVSDDVIADAIKRAENSKSHPYGILRAYCKPGDPNGQCRMGCLQTIDKDISKSIKRGIS